MAQAVDRWLRSYRAIHSFHDRPANMAPPLGVRTWAANRGRRAPSCCWKDRRDARAPGIDPSCRVAGGCEAARHPAAVDSLPQGILQGVFKNRLRSGDSYAVLCLCRSGLRQIPCAAGQGIWCAVTGIFLPATGSFRHPRESLTASLRSVGEGGRGVHGSHGVNPPRRKSQRPGRLCHPTSCAISVPTATPLCGAMRAPLAARRCPCDGASNGHRGIPVR
jgi:hypothetical protein